VPRTLVSFHAHPDDEALLTAGTLARAVAEGHRVVLVVATDGGAGLADPSLRGPALAARRVEELAASARALGVQRVVQLGYADSGWPVRPGEVPNAFSDAAVDEAAARLAAVLDDEHADVLTSYDPAGGYGHPDHVQVHRVGARAAELAATPVLLEATVDRTALLRALRLVHRLPGVPPDFAPARFAAAYTPREQITHRVDVRGWVDAKRASMAAHVSQAGGGDSARTLAVLLRLPRPVFRAVLGHEWYVQPGLPAGPKPLTDVFATAPRGRPTP
jgi:LmbE family N-acetylglucosaminyl deacetylase